MDIIGIKDFNQSVDGQSLTPLIKGNLLSEEPAYLETHYSIDLKSLDKIGIRTSEFKFFRDKNDPTKLIHLYDLKNDPHENNNIANIKPKIANEMEIILQDLISNTSPNLENYDEDETKKIEDELKKLGYI